MYAKLLLLAAAALAVAGCAGDLTTPSLGSDATVPMDGKMPGMQGMNHGSSMPTMGHGSKHGMHSMRGMLNAGRGAHRHAASAAGHPGSSESVDRTVEVTAYDTMRFKPESLTVRQGATIRFVVTNAGRLTHEFVIGTAEELREHAQMMRKMPNMEHEEPGGLTLEAGQTKTVVWQFTHPGAFQYACLIPGHYAAGMVGTVYVTTAEQRILPIEGPRHD